MSQHIHQSKEETSALLLTDQLKEHLILPVPPPQTFQCGETIVWGQTDLNDHQDDDTYDIDDDDDHQVLFYCQWPDVRVDFYCRDRSQNALLPQEASVTNDQVHTTTPQQDPHFFETGYTLAGRTGFQVWAGTRLLLESLTIATTRDNNNNHHHKRLEYWRHRLQTKQLNVIELGAGVGVLGISLAATTRAHVLLTDLPTLVQHSLRVNLKRNSKTNNNDDGDDNNSSSQRDVPAFLQNGNKHTFPSICAVPMAHGDRGWAGCTSLDWNRPVEDQLSPQQIQSIDLIVASDCVFLRSMLDSLLRVVGVMFAANPRATFLLSFQRRDAHEKSPMFATAQHIWNTLENEKGWNVTLLAWRRVFVVDAEKEDNVDQEEGTRKEKDTPEVFVLEITP